MQSKFKFKGKKIKKIIFFSILFVIAYFLWVAALTHYNRFNHSQEEWDRIRNTSDVGTAIVAIKTYKTNKGFMPESLYEIIHNDPLPYDWGELEKILSEKQIKYSKDGFKDNIGNSWLVILKDDKFPEIYFVSKFLHSEIIQRSTLVQDPFK